MTLDDLTFECVPMRARFSHHECEKQIATSRDYCVNCERGRGGLRGNSGLGSIHHIHHGKSPPNQLKILNQGRVVGKR